MKNILTTIGITLGVVLVLAMALMVIVRESPVGGLVHNTQEIFVAGIKAGSSETEVINSSAELTAVINTTVAATITGETNLDTLVFGGDIKTITSGTTTLTAAEVCDSSLVVLSQLDSSENVADLTMPTAANLIADCIPANGDMKFLTLENAATTTLDITIVTGGGSMELLEPTGGEDVVIQVNEWALFQFLNIDGTVVAAFVTSIQNAD